MLQNIRSASEHWLGKIVLTVIFTLLIAGVGIFGVEEFFRGGGGGNTVATVGKTPITAEAVRTAYQNQLQRIQAQAKRTFTPDQARMLGIDRQVMAQLITEASLDQKTRDLGLAVPDAAVVRSIHEEKSFQGPDGRFDPAVFYQTLQRIGLSEPAFVRDQRAFIARQQLAQAVATDLTVPQTMRDAVHRYTSERRAVSYLVLPPSVAGDIPAPGEDDLKAWYEGNKGAFRAPAFRGLDALVLNPDSLAKPEAIGEEEVRKAYEAGKGRFGNPERRAIQQVSFPNEAAAAAARAEIEAGTKTFAAVAAEHGVSGKDLDLGTLSKSELFDPAVAQAAFALPQGGLSAPVKGRFGTVLLHVTGIEPETVKPLSEVEPAIRRELALARARDEIDRARDAIEDQRAGGKPLAEIAKERGLPLVSLAAVDAQGKDPAGQRAVLPDPETVLPAAFRAEIGGDNEPLRTKAGGYVWYDVTRIDAARDRPLDEVRAGVTAGWHAAEVSRRLAAKGRELAERLDKGEGVEALGAEVGVNPETIADLARNQGREALIPDVVNRAFATPVGKAASAASGESRVVLKVTSATMPPYVPGGPGDRAIEESFRSALSDDVLGEYVADVQKNAGVTVNQAALQRALGGDF